MRLIDTSKPLDLIDAHIQWLMSIAASMDFSHIKRPEKIKFIIPKFVSDETCLKDSLDGLFYFTPTPPLGKMNIVQSKSRALRTNDLSKPMYYFDIESTFKNLNEGRLDIGVNVVESTQPRVIACKRYEKS